MTQDERREYFLEYDNRMKKVVFNVFKNEDFEIYNSILNETD